MSLSPTTSGTKKRCSRCKEEKQDAEFYRCTSSKDGCQNQCKKCQGENRSTYRFVSNGIKVCKGCKEAKPVDKFSLNKYERYGVNNKCKECQKKARLGKDQKVYKYPINVKEKVCSKCKEAKPVDEFGLNKRAKTWRKSRCKTCESIDSSNRYARNPEHSKQRSYASFDKVRKLDPYLTFARGTINSHKKRGVKVTIKASWLAQKLARIKFCPVCFKRLDIRDTHKNKPSADQLVPSYGLTLQNTRIICLQCNRQKSDLTLEQHIRLIRWVKSEMNKTFGTGIF